MADLTGLTGNFATSGTVAIVVVAGDRPGWSAPTGVPLTVNGILFIDGFELRSSNSDAIDNNGLLWLDRTIVAGSITNDGALTLRNTTVAASMTYGVLSSDSTAIDVLDATLVATQPIFCFGGVAVTIRNSMVLSSNDALDVDGCSTTGTTSAFASDDYGPGNAIVGYDAGWFVDVAEGDLHLTAMVPVELATLGVWLSGDPDADIDLDPRPTLDGTMDVVGADVP